jgi:rhomboid family GlyGly-CTERM serine protease
MLTTSEKLLAHARTWLLYTIALAILCVAAHVHQPLSDWLAYDRMAIQAGETWRLLTGHLTHYNADHLFWDVLAFVVLGVMLERRHRVGFITTVIASATAITAVLWFAHPKVAEYRGLSGIDSALFTGAAIHLYADGRRFKRPLVQLISTGVLAGFIAKLVYEFASGNTLFVDSADFVSLASVHAIGGIVGIISAVATRRCASALGSRDIPQGGSLSIGA